MIICIYDMCTQKFWSTPLGGLTRQLLKEGTTIDARIVNRDRSANPHF